MGNANNKNRVLVFDDMSALEDFALGRWEAIASEAVRGRGVFAAALSGGGTPVGLYRKLARLAGPSLWPGTHIFMVDERMVPPDSADSNFRMMNETLFSKAPIPAENIHRIPTDGPPELCATEYEAGLFSFFSPQPGGMPVFDLVLLGLGSDGHTASLFPGSEALGEKTRLASAVRDSPGKGGGKGHFLFLPRVTLTYPVLNSARNIFFLVSGQNKADVLRRVAVEADPALPASAIHPRDGKNINLLFLADSQAAGQLPAEKITWSGRAELF